MDETNMKSFRGFLIALWLVCVIFATLFFSFYVALSVDQDDVYIPNSEQVGDDSVADGEIKHQSAGIKSFNDVTSIVDEDDILFAYIKPSIAPATPLYLPTSSSMVAPMSSIYPSPLLSSAHDASIIDDTSIIDTLIKEHKFYLKSDEVIEKVDQKDVFEKDTQNKEKIDLLDNLNDDKLVFQSHSNAIEGDPSVHVLSTDELLSNEVGQQFRSRKIIEDSFNDNNLKIDDSVSWTLLMEQKFPEVSNLQNDSEIFHNQNFDKKIEAHFSDDVMLSDNLMDQNDLNDSKTPKIELDKNGDLYNSKPIKKEMLSFAEWKKKLDTEKEEVADGIVKSNNTKRKNLQMSSKRTIKKNYASIECGAKVIAANEEATNQIAILKEDKDTYMLNPCNVRAWFIVELCERIELDSIDLANFEMFSSSPESFNVYISSRYPTREWEKVGVFQGTPLKEIKTYTFDEKFYAKYMKIEIKKYFGSEHYCPLSLLRVFGITEVEQLDSEDHEDNDSSDDEILHENKTSYETINIFASAKYVMAKLVNTVAEKISGTKFRNFTNLKKDEINKSGSENVLHSDYVVLLPDEVDHDTSIIDSFEFMRSSKFDMSLNPKSRIWFDHSLILKSCPLKNFLTASFERQFNYTMSTYIQPEQRCTRQKMEDSINSVYILQPSFQTPLKSDTIELKNLYSFENSFTSQPLTNTIETSLDNYTNSSRERPFSKVSDVNEKELMSNQHLSISYDASVTTAAETFQIVESSLKFLEGSFSRPSLNIQETPSLSLIDSLSVHTILTADSSKSINSIQLPELSEIRESVPNKMAVALDEVGLNSNQTDNGTFMKGDEISKLILINQSVPLEVSVTYTSSNINFESFAEINSNTLSSIISEETTNNTNGVSTNNGVSETTNNGVSETTNNGVSETTNNGVSETTNNGVSETTNNGVSETTKTGMSGSKESIIMKLNAKVKALQANLTLSMMYLEEMSERYRTAVEEVDKRHNSKSLALNLSISSQKDISVTQAKLLSNLSHEILKLTDQLKSMTQSMEEQIKASEVQFTLIFVEFFLVIILVLAVCCKKTPVIINPSSKNDVFVQKNSKNSSQEELVVFSENRKRSFIQRSAELLQGHAVETVKKKRRKKNRPSLDDPDVDAKFSKNAGLLFSAGKGILSGITGAFCWRSFAYEKRSRFTEALLDTNLQRSDVRSQKKQLNRAKSLDLKTIHENESISQFSNRPRSVGAL